MSDFPTQNITIYHKNDTTWSRYIVEASFRDTVNLMHSKDGYKTNDSVIIRIFDVDGYNSTYFVDKGDVIVNQEISDKIEGQAPLTQLQKAYGNNNVYKINSITKFIYDDDDLKELNHIKLGCI